MLKCIRMTIARCYTLRLDTEYESDQKMIDMDDDSLKQAIVDKIIEDEGNMDFLNEDPDLDIEPQDIHIYDTYLV